jgi:hypothetical protein
MAFVITEPSGANSVGGVGALQAVNSRMRIAAKIG